MPENKLFNLSNIILIIIVISFGFLVFSIFMWNGSKEDMPNKVIIGDNTIFVELAQTREDHSKGLMNKTNLPEDNGMLFIFSKPRSVNLWMKNTLIPLDMIFIDEDNVIVNIETAQPCKEDPCKEFSSKVGVKFVLEVNAGYADNHNIKQGDEIILLLDE
ncbi:DUF192 domain-containing protein [Nanoarchaeota archaeon]